MTEVSIITGATAAGGKLYAAVDPGIGRMGAVGHSEATARLAPYRDTQIAIDQLVALGATLDPQERTT